MSGAGLYERQFEYLLPSHAQEAELAAIGQTPSLDRGKSRRGAIGKETPLSALPRRYPPRMDGK